MEEGRRKTYAHEPDDLELRDEFRKPRDSLLCMASEFYTKCFSRLKELRKIMADPSFRPPELFDNKTHNVCISLSFLYCVLDFFALIIICYHLQTQSI